jgi:hypothetical protein
MSIALHRSIGLCTAKSAKPERLHGGLILVKVLGAGPIVVIGLVQL